MNKEFVYMNHEAKFTHKDIVLFYLFFRGQLSELKTSEGELHEYLKKILPLFTDQALSNFSTYFTVDREKSTLIGHNEAWMRFEKYFERSATDSMGKDYINLSVEDKYRHILSELNLDLKATMLKHICTFAICNDLT